MNREKIVTMMNDINIGREYTDNENIISVKGWTFDKTNGHVSFFSKSKDRNRAMFKMISNVAKLMKYEVVNTKDGYLDYVIFTGKDAIEVFTEMVKIFDVKYSALIAEYAKKSLRK